MPSTYGESAARRRSTGWFRWLGTLVGILCFLNGSACGGKVEAESVSGQGGSPSGVGTSAASGGSPATSVTPPPPMRHYSIATGSHHSCALHQGKVYCWGENVEGQLGDGTTTDRLRPVEVQGLPLGASAVTAGYRHTCALVDGAVYCWGVNRNHQLGNEVAPRSVLATKVEGLSAPAESVDAGYYHTCAVAAGIVQCWGSNAFKQIDGRYEGDPSAPIPRMGVAMGATVVGAGIYHTCAVVPGQVQCWGHNGEGRLGDGTATLDANSVSNVVDLGGQATSVAVGANHSCVLVDGGVFCWGANTKGQLGLGSPGGESQPRPKSVAELSSDVASIAGGDQHSCAVRDNQAYCWGDNSSYQLGAGIDSPQVSAVPVKVRLPMGVIDVDASTAHTCARIDERVYCWGDNSYGQLGIDSTGSSALPVEVLLP